MKYLVLTAIIFASFSSNSQIKSSGSFFIVAACKDGIVMGADTRGAFYNTDSVTKEKITYASYDPIQKVYQMNGYGLIYIGNITIKESKNWHYYYIEQFKKIQTKQLSLKDDANLFFGFIKNKYPEVFNQFKAAQIVFADYENGRPMLCIAQDGVFKCSDEFIVPDYKCGFDKLYNKNDSCKKIASIIGTTILKFASASNQTDFIGGYITVLKISKNNKFSWLTKKPTKEGWRNYKEFYEDYKNGKVNLYFKSEESKEFILKQIVSNL